MYRKIWVPCKHTAEGTHFLWQEDDLNKQGKEERELKTLLKQSVKDITLTGPSNAELQMDRRGYI